MSADLEAGEVVADVVFTFGEITEDDLGLKASDIQQLVVAPTDWTISVLVDLLKRGKIDLQPNYQRRVAWDEGKMSRFVESLFMRLPVPQIVLAELRPGVFAVIDGKQRMNSLARYCLDQKNPLRLAGCEYIDDLNGKTYDDVVSDQRMEGAVDAFESHTVRTVVLKNWKSDNILYLLFLRLNQNSVTLSPQELRRALYPGKFMNWLDDKTSASAGMALLFNKVPDFRMRDMEIATRYLAYRKFAGGYSGNMKKVLDETSDFYAKSFEVQAGTLDAEWQSFEDAMALTKEVFGDDAFKSGSQGKYQRSFNRAVLDVMTFYFSDANMRATISPAEYPSIKSDFEQLSDKSVDFSQSVQTSTKTVRATSQRFHDWEDVLRARFGQVVPVFPLPKNP